MKVLVISNFYPPFSRGGMEISCESVVHGLARRGHKPLVLTSTYGVSGENANGIVHRKLKLQMELNSIANVWSTLQFRSIISHNSQILKSTIDDFIPDVIFIWGMWNIDKNVAALAEQLMGNRVLYRMADYWPTLGSQRKAYWAHPANGLLGRSIKRIIRPVALAYLRDEREVHTTLPYAFCVSKAVREELSHHGIETNHMPVIHTGFELSAFMDDSPNPNGHIFRGRNLLYAGRITPTKGVEHLLEAFAMLVEEGSGQNWRLKLVGTGEPSYLKVLYRQARALGVLDRIEFLGSVSQSQMPGIMAKHGIVVVPSVWSDPLPRVAVEAMASGCIVVASRIGGIPEIIEHNKSGLLVEAGNSEALSKVLGSLDAGEVDIRAMAKQARIRASREFAFGPMLDKVEWLLHEVAELTNPASISILGHNEIADEMVVG